jgi:hypothetical protein
VRDSSSVHSTYDGDEPRTKVVFSNGDSEELWLSSQGDDLFLLEESSFVRVIYYRDVIRASREGDGSLRFQEVVRPSDLWRESWILSKQKIQSTEMQRVLQEVMDLGGNWEQALGGCLIVHIPMASAAVIKKHLEAIGITVRGEQR